MILYTAQRVVSPRGLSGVNAFCHHDKFPPSTHVEVPPGGNAVRSFLDVMAPDDATLIEILDRVTHITEGPGTKSLPLTVSSPGWTFTFACDLALAPVWRTELRTLSLHLCLPRRPPQTQPPST